MYGQMDATLHIVLCVYTIFNYHDGIFQGYKMLNTAIPH